MGRLDHTPPSPEHAGKDLASPPTLQSHKQPQHGPVLQLHQPLLWGSRREGEMLESVEKHVKILPEPPLQLSPVTFGLHHRKPRRLWARQATRTPALLPAHWGTKQSS